MYNLYQVIYTLHIRKMHFFPRKKTKTIQAYLLVLNKLLVLKFSIFSFIVSTGLILLFSSREDLPGNLFLISILVFTIRSFGICINNLIDLKIDIRNPRTKDRILPQKKISRRNVVLIMFFAVFTYSCIMLRLYDTRLYLLSLVPIIVSSIYPYMKRITVLSHFVLSSIHSMLPFGIYLCLGAPKKYFLTVVTTSFFLFLWISYFDIIYSKLDEDFDKREFLYSASSIFSEAKLDRIIVLMCAFISMTYCYLLYSLNFGYLWMFVLGTIMSLPLVFFKYMYLTKSLSERYFFFCNLAISIILTFALFYRALAYPL